MNFVFRRDELLVEEATSVLPDLDACVRAGLGAEALQPVWACLLYTSRCV